MYLQTESSRKTPPETYRIKNKKMLRQNLEKKLKTVELLYTLDWVGQVKLTFNFFFKDVEGETWSQRHGNKEVEKEVKKKSELCSTNTSNDAATYDLKNKLNQSLSKTYAITVTPKNPTGRFSFVAVLQTELISLEARLLTWLTIELTNPRLTDL